MSGLVAAFREYGFNQYAVKEAAVATALVRYAFDAAACWRARFAGNAFEQARSTCQAIRLLEGHATSRKLLRLHHQVLEHAGLQGARTNQVRAAYLSLPIAAADRRQYLQHGKDYAVRMKFPRIPEDPRRQGNLVVLKAHDPARGEKGVLYLQYTESIRSFVALFDVPALAKNYRLVVEPSTWGYQDESFLLLIEPGFDVLVQAQDQTDYDYIAGLQSNLIPLRLGAGDWIDPENFFPEPGGPKDFDFVMVASWSPVKRHAVLFDALASAGLLDARVALVGYPWEGCTRQHIEAMAARAGLRRVEIFERIPRTEVAAVLRRSRVGVMLTRREGANRGIYECLFSDVPIVVPAANRGVNKALLNATTGRLATDTDLPRVLAEVLAGYDRFKPRAWATQNTGYEIAWKVLNSRMAELAQRSSEPYETSIAMTKSAPAAAYVDDAVRLELDAEYGRLLTYLRTDVQK